MQRLALAPDTVRTERWQESKCNTEFHGVHTEFHGGSKQRFAQDTLAQNASERSADKILLRETPCTLRVGLITLSAATSAAGEQLLFHDQSRRRHIEYTMNNLLRTPGVADPLYEGLRRWSCQVI